MAKFIKIQDTIFRADLITIITYKDGYGISGKYAIEVEYKLLEDLKWSKLFSYESEEESLEALEQIYKDLNH